jgi:hypothetical protein
MEKTGQRRIKTGTRTTTYNETEGNNAGTDLATNQNKRETQEHNNNKNVQLNN